MSNKHGLILAQVKFGTQRDSTKEQLSEVAENYLVFLKRAGQIWGEYLLAWSDGVLGAYLMLAAPDAFREENHSRYGIEELAKVREAFGNAPYWLILDDDCPKEPITWKDAPFLYLFTHAFDKSAPVNHGKSGAPIPTYMIPIPLETKEGLYRWQGGYRELDNIHLGSGVLEIPAYRQLADPNSELSQEGRNLCRQIEIGTGIPTFYYLMKYWARETREGDRLCPGCGNIWKVEGAKPSPKRFYHFDFRCDKCRLVSHLGVSTDGGDNVQIGEFQERDKQAGQGNDSRTNEAKV